jgi:hypothetical protein
VLALGALGCQRSEPVTRTIKRSVTDTHDPWSGSTAGDERVVAGIKLCWCPAGRFVMGSPASEPERRPGED